MIHVHIDKEAAKSGAPCITVSRAECGSTITQGRSATLSGSWELTQNDAPLPCGASVVLAPTRGYLEGETLGALTLDGKQVW